MANRNRRNDNHRGTLNRNARISSRVVGSAVETRTVGRDSGDFRAEVTTNSNLRTLLSVARSGRRLTLTGREARTIYLMLEKHFSTVSSS